MIYISFCLWIRRKADFKILQHILQCKEVFTGALILRKSFISRTSGRAVVRNPGSLCLQSARNRPVGHLPADASALARALKKEITGER
mmetsp:Transcript_16555/g.31468  ORF Transcript_16555/g.31468 Transcript_16555/m.31468 type:complete len:88 (+) Transcript_16555:958-1221(+)